MNKLKDWDKIITDTISLKNKIVVADPFEKNVRKSLNFGHTIGHAFESYFMNKKNSLLHGEAIAIGMICEAYLSYKINRLSKSSLQDITNYIFSTFGKISVPRSLDTKLVELMIHDKKNENGQINFSLISRIGKMKINQTIKKELIFESLDFYRKALIK